GDTEPQEACRIQEGVGKHPRTVACDSRGSTDCLRECRSAFRCDIGLTLWSYLTAGHGTHAPAASDRHRHHSSCGLEFEPAVDTKLSKHRPGQQATGPNGRQMVTP